MVSGFGGRDFQLCRVEEEQKDENGEEENDAEVVEEEGKEGSSSQKSSDWPMAASVNPEIHMNLQNGDKIRIRLSDQT